MTYFFLTFHLCQLLFFLTGTAILRPHLSVGLATFIFLTVGTLQAHSGYNFPFTHSSLNHDFHHFAFNECFGPLGLLDSFFKTDGKFQASLKDGMERFGGSKSKAREALLEKLARWELEESKKVD